MKSNLFANWWSFALSGVIALLYGILAFYNPEGMLNTIVTYFGIIILLVGLSMLVGVISNYRNEQPYVTELIWAILTIGIGGILTFYTSEAVKIFVIIIGIWALIVGGVQLYIAMKLDKEDKNRITFLINGVVTLIFGVILFFDPFHSANFLLQITGVLALIIGVMLIFLAIKMKGMAKQLED